MRRGTFSTWLTSPALPLRRWVGRARRSVGNHRWPIPLRAPVQNQSRLKPYHGAGRMTMNRHDRAFWDRVNIQRGCWEWRGEVSKGMRGGYGVFRKKRVHRLSYEAVRGPIPLGLFVCHHCDNRRCVRPSHLFVGTAKDNTMDMVRKGRHKHTRGESTASSKLTENGVRDIRDRIARGERVRAIARLFGVHWSQITLIKTGKAWKHVA